MRVEAKRDVCVYFKYIKNSSNQKTASLRSRVYPPFPCCTTLPHPTPAQETHAPIPPSPGILSQQRLPCMDDNVH